MYCCCAVAHAWMTGSQGIHDISLILGIEASRDLEEQTFTGVSCPCDVGFIHRGLTILRTDDASRTVHGFCDQASHRAHTYPACGHGNDERAARSLPVRLTLTLMYSLVC